MKVENTISFSQPFVVESSAQLHLVGGQLSGRTEAGSNTTLVISSGSGLTLDAATISNTRVVILPDADLLLGLAAGQGGSIQLSKSRIDASLGSRSVWNKGPLLLDSSVFSLSGDAKLLGSFVVCSFVCLSLFANLTSSDSILFS
jgi:hypothetical protein